MVLSNFLSLDHLQCIRPHLTPDPEDWLLCCFPPIWFNVKGRAGFKVWQGSSGSGCFDSGCSSSNASGGSCCNGSCGGIKACSSDGGDGSCGDGGGRHLMKESGSSRRTIFLCA